jgi:CDP-glucose 4,6-dehydratase
LEVEITFPLIPQRLLFTLIEPRLRTEALVEHTTSHWQGRRVLVTGCTGLLGSAVSHELLGNGAEVVGLIRDRSRAVQFEREIGDKRFHIVHGVVEDAIRLHTAMAVHDVSAVFHFATDSERGFDALVRAATIHDPRMPVITARPMMQFRIAKTASPSIPLGVTRFGELFGADRRIDRLVSRTVLALLTGSAIPPAVGSVRDYVHARDAARACLLTAERLETVGNSLDLTFRSGWEMSERTMTEQIAEVYSGQSATSPTEPAANPLEWKPLFSLSDSLRETIDWYRTNQQSLAATRQTGLRKAA